ncbi:MAG: hypothetical protein QOH06_3117 [Acidobacteriota bacterium]|jgi:hypothetical protein|nr:hypothetical protein [Acidobacteriota bacterium]
MSKTLWVRILLAAILTLVVGCGGDAPPSRPAPPPPSPAIEQAAVTDAFGYYFLEDPAALPAWAQSIDHLHLSNIELKGEEIVKVPLEGFIRMEEEAGGRDYHLQPVRLEGQALSFKTQEIDGISYDFEGDFLVSGELPTQAPQGTVLKGRLRRLERGSPAGELAARFNYTPGD